MAYFYAHIFCLGGYRGIDVVGYTTPDSYCL